MTRGIKPAKDVGMTESVESCPPGGRDVDLAEYQQRRAFISQFVNDHPGTTAAQVESVLDVAGGALGPSGNRQELTAAVERVLAEL